MMANKKLVIVGASETAKIAYEYFTHDSDYEVVAFTVEKQFYHEKTLFNLPIYEFENIEQYFPCSEYDLFIALGSAGLSHLRRRLYDMAKEKGYGLASYISSRAFVWHNVKLGDNCFILEDNTLQTFVEIGNNVTLWSGNHIGHGSIIRDNCFITSQVVISGLCEVRQNTFMGVNSAVAEGIKISRDNYIAMGAVINKHTAEDTIYKGNPAAPAPISAKVFCKVKE